MAASPSVQSFYSARIEVIRVVRAPGGMTPVGVVVSQLDSLDVLHVKVRQALKIEAGDQIVALTDHTGCVVDGGFGAISLCAAGVLHVNVQDPVAAADADKFASASPTVMAGWKALMASQPGLKTMMAAVASNDPTDNDRAKRFCRAALHHGVSYKSSVAGLW